MRLKIAIRAGDVSHFDCEQDVASVVGPTQLRFHTLVISNATRLGADAGCEINYVDLHVLVLFLALVDGIADEREFAAVRRGEHAVHAQCRGRERARARAEVWILFGLSFFFVSFCGCGEVARNCAVHIHFENGVAAFSGAVLHDVFPLLLVIIFLSLAPGLAGREVDFLRVRGP